MYNKKDRSGVYPVQDNELKKGGAGEKTRKRFFMLVESKKESNNLRR